jgi:hypothetical protein
MPMATKRRLRYEGSGLGPFPSLESAPSLVEYMNSRHGNPGFDRIEQVAGAMNELDRLVRSTGYADGTYSKIEKGKFGKAAQQLSKVVAKFVDEYRVSVGVGAPRPHGWERLYMFFADAFGRKSTIKQTYLGGVFVLDAAFQGLLRSISQCPCCQKWFAIRRRNQRFCSDGCREKEFRSSKAGQAKRAKYMREYRARLRQLNEAGLRSVQKTRR